MAERLSCKQQVAGSRPTASSLNGTQAGSSAGRARFSYKEEAVGSSSTLPMMSRGGGKADAPHSNCGGPEVHVGSIPTLGMQTCGDGSRGEPLRAREKMRVQVPLAAPDREGWLSLAKSTCLLSGRPQGHAGSNPAPSARTIYFGPVARLVEQWIFNPQGESSNLSRLTDSEVEQG